MTRTGNDHITPTLYETMTTVIDSYMTDVHVCFPAKIVIYDSSSQYADIQPSLMQLYEDQFDLGLPATRQPIIPNVPVIFPRGAAGKSYVHVPLLPGDDVTVVVSQRSLDKWKVSGSLTDPKDRRKFNKTDAFCFPGGSGKTFAFSPQNPLALEIGHLAAVIQLLATGNIKLGGNAATFSAGIAEAITARFVALETKLNAHITIFDAHIHNIITPVPATPVTPPLTPDTPFVPPATPLGSVTIKVSP